jgi:phosphatidylinositol glycan class T
MADLEHHLIPHPFQQLCTENLTPFLSLLPSKGLSGLSSLLAQPGIIFSWGFKAEGIDVVMPDGDQPGRWRGWWEGVVDLNPQDSTREFSLGSLFRRGVPKIFPEAGSSVLRLITKKDVRVDPECSRKEDVVEDGRQRMVREWNLLDERLQHQDIRVSWEEEGRYRESSESRFQGVTACLSGPNIFLLLSVDWYHEWNINRRHFL